MAHLSVLGLGLRCPEQVTRRAWSAMEQADQLFFISDHLEKQSWLARLNPNYYDLMVHYGKGKLRRDTYQEMADKVLECLQAGKDAALISYGHPLVFCDPSRLAIEQTKEQGFSLEIMPGISSIDCLLADLRVDVQNHGMQIYEGHDLLLHGLRPDPMCSQIVFQVPSLGDNAGYWKPGRFRGFIRVLAEQLAEVYGWQHPAVLYFGSNSPGQANHIDSITLEQLPEAEMISEYTLWVPPLGYAMLPPEMNTHSGPVQLELVGIGLDWDDRTQEVEALLSSGRPLFTTVPLQALPEAVLVEGPDQLPQPLESALLLFAAHPCATGAMEWARAAEQRGWSYRIRPGISWEDGVYCDVPLDPGLLGFQSFPAGQEFEQPVHLATLARGDRAPRSGRHWGPISRFSDQAQADSLGLFFAGPDPRPIVDGPFLRALSLSGVERLEAFLESTSPEFQAQLSGPSVPRIWLMRQIQWAERRLRQGLSEAQLGAYWASHLLHHPDHPLANYLLLKLRCDDALKALGQGLSAGPLENWMESRRHV